MAGAPKKISDEELLHRIMDLARPVTSSGEIAEGLPVIQKTVEKRLTELSEKGLVERKLIGNSYAYWLNDRGRAILEAEGIDQGENDG